MENQNEIVEVMEQGSKKGMLKKLALVATGLAVGVGTIIFFRKKKLAKQQTSEEVEISEDSNESSEN